MFELWKNAQWPETCCYNWLPRCEAITSNGCCRSFDSAHHRGSDHSHTRTVVQRRAIILGSRPQLEFRSRGFPNEWLAGKCSMHPVETIWRGPARVCERGSVCVVFSCRPCVSMCPCNISVCIKACAHSFPPAVRVPDSIQHLDQQVSPPRAHLLLHTPLISIPFAEGTAIQLLTFPRLHIQPHIVLGYCDRDTAVFHHIQQSTDSVLESLELRYIRSVLFYFTFHVV